MNLRRVPRFRTLRRVRGLLVWKRQDASACEMSIDLEWWRDGGKGVRYGRISGRVESAGIRCRESISSSHSHKRSNMKLRSILKPLIHGLLVSPLMADTVTVTSRGGYRYLSIHHLSDQYHLFAGSERQREFGTFSEATREIPGECRIVPCDSGQPEERHTAVLHPAGRIYRQRLRRKHLPGAARGLFPGRILACRHSRAE